MKTVAMDAPLTAALIFVALVSPASAQPLSTQPSEIRSWCYGENSTDVERITGCTMIILSGRESPMNLAGAHFNRGMAYGHEHDVERAMADYTEAIKLNPKDTASRVNRGNLYTNTGEFERAFADFNEAIRLDPKSSFAYLNRGLANLFTGALANARADLSRASELDSKFAYAALWLEIANRRGNQPSRLAEATKEIDMTIWPAPVLRLYLGQLTPEAVLAAAKNPDATTKETHVCEANFYLGEFYLGELALGRGVKDEATRLFRLAEANCPETRDSATIELKALGATP